MSQEKILIIPQNWLGDVIMSQVLIKKIKYEKSNAKIHILVNSKFKDLANRMNEVDKVLELDCSHKEFGFIKRYKLAKKISNSYDHSIVLSRSIKSSLIPFMANIKKRTGELGECRFILVNDIKKFTKSFRRKTANRYLSMYGNAEISVKKNYYPSLNKNEKNLERLVKKFSINTSKQIVIFAPGAAFGPSKMWPQKKFLDLANKINDNYLILVMGTQEEEKLGGIICENNTQRLNLCGKTTIVDAIDLMHLSKFCVSNDSGLMHLSAATNTKTISIYGSTSPVYTPPLTENKHIFYKELSCSPCFNKRCKFNHYDCLNNIYAEDVFKSLK